MKQILKEYLDSWICKDVEVVKRTFANDVVYTECYGPQYHGFSEGLARSRCKCLFP